MLLQIPIKLRPGFNPLFRRIIRLEYHAGAIKPYGICPEATPEGDNPFGIPITLGAWLIFFAQPLLLMGCNKPLENVPTCTFKVSGYQHLKKFPALLH
jgi:hypothetical protein